MKLRITFLMMAFVALMNAQIVNIPDANFKAKLLSSNSSNNVAKDLLDNSIAIDTNNDGEIQVTEAQNISLLNVSDSNITSMVGIQSFVKLKKLDCSFNQQLTSLDLQGLTQLNDLNVSFGILTSLNIHGLTQLQSLNCAENLLTSIDLEGLTQLSLINCGGNKLTSLNIQNIPSLVAIECGANLLTSLNIQNNTLLSAISCRHNQLSTLDVQNNPLLENIDCSYNQITSLNLQNNPLLADLYCTNNQLTSLNITTNPLIYFLDCNNNQLTSLDLHNNTELRSINCSYNQISSLDLQGRENLFFVRCNNNQIETLDVSASLGLEVLDCSSNLLKSLFFKTGFLYPINYFFDTASPESGGHCLANNPTLQYICCDDFNKDAIQAKITQYGYANCEVNTYCSFVPGGNYNTITGTVRLDENNNGCDTNDEFFEHMKLKIDDGTNTSETFVKNNGEFDFYTQEGSFTVTAEPENPSLFTVTPVTFSTSFADNNNNLFTQNICVTKNGNGNDLEVVIAPETNAVPGFDAKYKLMWRNKGNTTLSGNVTFTFDSSKMSFISSTIPYASISGNQITYNFSNLKPYGNTATEVDFTINTPTNPTNPVNSGDILNFTAAVTPLSGDINPEDNNFSFKQTVINSFDPNDIVCLEGNSIPVSMVGKYLHYIVNFENTGTAPATNIVVEMDINADDFDISTLQLQNSSHQVYTRIKGNKVEFIMKNVNLGNGGHGNVIMKILSKNTLTSGDEVSNKANIYFDYNFPIVTNDEVTTIKNILQTTETDNDNSITVYPNPTKGEININAESKITSVDVYDVQGRIIQKQIGINGQSTKLSIRSNSTGVFLIKVNTEKGIQMKKIIKN